MIGRLIEGYDYIPLLSKILGYYEFPKKPSYSQNNRITFLDLVPWNLNSEIFEESNIEDKLIYNECKVSIKHNFKLIKANRLFKIIIKYKK